MSKFIWTGEHAFELFKSLDIQYLHKPNDNCDKLPKSFVDARFTLYTDRRWLTEGDDK